MFKSNPRLMSPFTPPETLPKLETTKRNKFTVKGLFSNGRRREQHHKSSISRNAQNTAGKRSELISTRDVLISMCMSLKCTTVTF